MNAQTDTLLQECRSALLRQSDERVAALLAQWFENLIGEEYLDEERDDLCLLLDYRVRSWSSQVSYATYTSWWEVEGCLEPSGGVFTCADIAALRQRLLDLPLEQFDLLLEMAYRTRLTLAERESGPPLPEGWEGLREMATWLEQADPAALEADLKAAPLAYTRFEGKEQKRKREEARAALAIQQGYLVIASDLSHVVIDTYRNWCKKQKKLSIVIEPRGRKLALLRVQTKLTDLRESVEVMHNFRLQLPTLAAPYLANARAQGYDAALNWIFKHQVLFEGILAADAQSIAQEILALWEKIVTEAKQHASELEARRREALIPAWKRELTRWREEGNAPELPPLAAEVVLPPEWGEMLTREHLIAFLQYLNLPTTTRASKASLIQRIQERLAADPDARPLFFEVFKRELAVPPWELETLLPCTPTERKRWTDEERLPILELRNVRKGGDLRSYPVFDRRAILTLPASELDQWRAEHQALTREHRNAAAKAAADRRKDSRPSSSMDR
ncbi:MAG TPA: hypothetical protein VF458_24210 [Ktedonobacteraceae bacterium]